MSCGRTGRGPAEVVGDNQNDVRRVGSALFPGLGRGKFWLLRGCRRIGSGAGTGIGTAALRFRFKQA